MLDSHRPGTSLLGQARKAIREFKQGFSAPLLWYTTGAMRQEPERIDTLHCGLSHKHLLRADATAPLALMVHGRAGSYDNMWAFRRCVPEHWSIIAPQAPLDDHEHPGKSWWIVDHDPERIAAHACAALPPLVDFVNRALVAYKLTPAFVVGVGFSQGAGMLSTFMQFEPERFRGVALLAGFVVRLTPPPRFTGARPSVFMAHGTLDERVPRSQALEGREYLRGHGITTQYVEDPVGHKVGVQGMKALTEWLAFQDATR